MVVGPARPSKGSPHLRFRAGVAAAFSITRRERGIQHRGRDRMKIGKQKSHVVHLDIPI
jgi:hypothetical protein